ncbi:proline--tRNA ligase, partial [Candidatus Micrarchaeota archaeon]|nr:proline--tRNA ligase [Candidatus Micrarchaeota archaeon]
MDFSEWYNEIIKKAELSDLRYNLKGFLVLRPNAVRVIKRMYELYERELEGKGHLPVIFPSLIPEKNLATESEHVEGFVPEVFWVTEAGKNKLEERYALRPTSETAMYPMYALWINGKKDLPLKLYQSCQVWRYETKATKPFIRTREFYWIEAHDVFATEKEAMAQVKEDMETSEKMIRKTFCIPYIPFKRPQWDKFAGAVNSYAADAILPDGKVLQLPATHMLGQNFSKAFGIKYMDEKGNQEYGWQTCYGPGISRIYAALISVHGDEKGLRIPFVLSSEQIVVVPIYKKGEEKEVLERAKEIEKELKEYNVKIDDSENTPGYKFNQHELLGIPLRIEIGKRDIENGTVVVFRRDLNKKETVKRDELKNRIKEIEKEFDANLLKQAEEGFVKRMSSAETMEELGEILKRKGGFVKVPFCTDGKEAENCAELIKEKTSGNVRGSIYGK